MGAATSLTNRASRRHHFLQQDIKSEIRVIQRWKGILESSRLIFQIGSWWLPITEDEREAKKRDLSSNSRPPHPSHHHTHRFTMYLWASCLTSLGLFSSHLGCLDSTDPSLWSSRESSKRQEMQILIIMPEG